MGGAVRYQHCYGQARADLTTGKRFLHPTARPLKSQREPEKVTVSKTQKFQYKMGVRHTQKNS